MSAYVVHPDTIDYIVTAANRYRESFYAPVNPHDTDVASLAAMPVSYDGNTYRIDGSDCDLLGSILFAQNVRSVNARYSLTDSAPDYSYRSVRFDAIDPVVLLKSIACLRYQSCETDDYAQTFAATVLDRIERAAIAHLRGYTDAPWGWTR